MFLCLLVNCLAQMDQLFTNKWTNCLQTNSTEADSWWKMQVYCGHICPMYQVLRIHAICNSFNLLYVVWMGKAASVF